MNFAAKVARLKTVQRSAHGAMLQQVLQDYRELLNMYTPLVRPSATESASIQDLQLELRRAHAGAQQMAAHIEELETTNQCLRAALANQGQGPSATLVGMEIAARLGVPNALSQINSKSDDVRKARDTIRDELHARGFSWDDIGLALGIGGRSAQTIFLRKKHNAQ